MPDKKVNNDDLNSDKETDKSGDKTPKDEGHVEDSSKPDKKHTEKKEKLEAKDSVKKDNKDAKEVSEKKSSVKKETKKPPVKKSDKDANPDSNYQVSLVDENTLKIKIKTDKGVSLNSTVGGKNVLPEEVEGLLNKLGTGKEGEIEIEISINPEKKTGTVEEVSGVKDEDKKEEKSEDSPGVLIPNPEVKDVVEKKVPLEDEVILTEEEILREKIGRKSPYNIYRRIYAQNFQMGLIGGVIIYLIAIFSFYSVASQDKIVEEEQQQRLIVLQDLPDPKIKLENIEDPNAPVKEEETEEDGTVPKRIPIKRNFNRPPTVKRPQVENRDTTGINDTTGLADTNSIKGDTSTASGNPFPDSLMVSYSGNEIGLIMNYPNNWKLIDSRDINKTMKEFNGVLLVDTTIAEGTFNMFVKIDDEGKPFDRDKYKHPFVMNDSGMTTFRADPYELAGKTEYHFYIFGGKNNLSAYAVVNIDKFEKYKPSIEAVVRSISFAPPPPQ